MAALVKMSARKLMERSCLRVISTSTALRYQEGHINEAGGKFAEKGKAIEDQYYRKLQAEQLKKLKMVHVDEIQQHEMEIKRLQALIGRHKEDIEHLIGHEEELLK